LRNILGAVAEQVFELLAVELLDHFPLTLHNVWVLLVEHVQSAFVLEQHLQKAAAALQHFVEAVV